MRDADRSGTFPRPAQIAKARDAGPKLIDMLRRMHQAGVKIAFGTDTGVSAHDHYAQEFALMVRSGMTPLQSVEATTIGAADHFGVSLEIGSIAAGKAADIIAANDDPLTNVRELEFVDFVMRAGSCASGGIGEHALVLRRTHASRTAQDEGYSTNGGLALMVSSRAAASVEPRARTR